MHHIQKTILTTLAGAPTPLRFSQLQPPNVPNNSYAYHLKRLVEWQYVEHLNGSYVATRKALKIINDLDGRRNRKPHVLTALYVTNDKDEVLLIKRFNHPFKDLYGIPSGHIQAGESVREAAVRELFEKTSVDVPESQLELKGTLDFRYVQHESKDLFLHGLSFVFKHHFVGDGSALEGRETKHGVLAWSKLLNTPAILPEVKVISDLIKREDLMVVSVDLEEPAPVA